jgi:hypothetical protein
MDLVFIEWEDSQGCPQGWQLFQDVSFVPVRIRSVGWALREDGDSITLVPHVGRVEGEENQGQGIMTIPKRCIIERRALKL